MISNRLACRLGINTPWEWIYFLILRVLASAQATGIREAPAEETTQISSPIARIGQNSPSHPLRLVPQCKVKALVVDDHPLNRDKLLHILGDIGVELDYARSGVEAMEKAHVQLPDIIFMDMRMMVMGGKEALTVIQQKFNECKIVILTASALDYRRDEYIKVGCHYLISKPFLPEAIYECLARLAGAVFEGRQGFGLTNNADL